MLLGTTGTIGAGKSTAVSYLEKRGFRHVSVSDYLKKETMRRGLSPDRIHKRKIGNEYRQRSPTALIEAVFPKTGFSGSENIVVEALHTVSEVAYIKGLGGKILSLDAPLPLRWERIQARADEKDSTSYDVFLAEQNRQMASDNPDENNLAAAIEAADYHVENSGTPEELFANIDAILAELHG